MVSFKVLFRKSIRDQGVGGLLPPKGFGMERRAVEDDPLILEGSVPAGLCQ